MRARATEHIRSVASVARRTTMQVMFHCKFHRHWNFTLLRNPQLVSLYFGWKKYYSRPSKIRHCNHFSLVKDKSVDFRIKSMLYKEHRKCYFMGIFSHKYPAISQFSWKLCDKTFDLIG